MNYILDYFCANMQEKETNIENNEINLLNSKIKQVRVGIFGSKRPDLYTQIVFYIGICTAFIFGLWNAISYFILKFPLYLKEHKGVDVEAIVELRGRELGFIDDVFYSKLSLFYFCSSILWLIIFGCFFLLWRLVKWSNYIILTGIIGYIILMIALFGSQFFKEDTTLFDKLALILVFLLVLGHTIIQKSKTNKSIDEPFQ
ncbi:MAG: hypothetical protein M9916_11780 [Crocinitomicaceae bacterium]|nr:hypothetical protein [Crocinitomicaceae bacterium]